MEFTTTDCLVLKIEERDKDSISHVLDTTMYVLYDKKEHNFVIRGKRKETTTRKSCTYSYICETVHELEYFISFIICKDNLWTYVLYNYDNLPSNSNLISYDLFADMESEFYELSAYDKIKYNKKNLINKLNMLRHVFNYYY